MSHPVCKGLKIAWIKQLIFSKNLPWVTLLNATITNANNITNLGPLYITQILKNIRNTFWKDTLYTWVEFCTINKPLKYDEIITSPIWYNPYLNFQPKLITNWYTNKIYYIKDLIQDNKILLEHEIRVIYNIKPIDFLTFHRIHMSLKKSLENIDQDNTIIYPIIPHSIKCLLNNKKGIRQYYKILRNKSRIKYTNPKWENELNVVNINSDTWQLVFKICFNNIKHNYLNWFQYKILNRTLGVNSLLYKMKISETHFCRLCSEHEENMLHLFCLCDNSVTLWNQVLQWIKEKIKIQIALNNKDIILGYLLQSNYSTPINTIILCTKSYIFRTAYNKKNLQLAELINYIKSTYSEQKAIATLNNKLTTFIKRWNSWVNLF